MIVSDSFNGQCSECERDKANEMLLVKTVKLSAPDWVRDEMMLDRDRSEGCP